jgi:hypothetical protein
MRRTSLFLLIILLVAGGMELTGQAYNSTSVNQRVALVIGNSDYDAGPLLNPENDAKAMASALRKTGFEVLEYINLASPAEMKRAIRDFGRKIQNGGVGLFYYAGHGIQVGGKNYLIPTKAQIFAEEEVEYEGVDVGFVMSQMEIARNRMNIIILDACRNNPFARSWRSAGGGGLAFIDAPAGTLIAYSTAPGKVASDGTGANGLYTEELLKQIQHPGLKIEDVFKNVRVEVLQRSNNMQTPWESSSLVGDFYFIRPETSVADRETLAAENRISENRVKENRVEEFVPKTVETRANAEWKMVNGNYFFYRNGADITGNTRAATVDNDVLLYDASTGKSYVLENYWNIKDQGNHAAKELMTSSNAFWRVNKEKSFWFYIEGEDVSGNIANTYYGQDLLIFDKKSNRYYVMNGYSGSEPGNLYPATSVTSPNQTLWWADQKFYYLVVNGEQIAPKTWNQWKGNNLIVHDETASSSYLLRNYYNNTDQVLRPAEILYSPGLISCSRDNQNQYYLYKNNSGYLMYGPASYSDQDLLVYDTIFQQTLVFQNFLGTQPNVRINATPVYSQSGAVWRRLDNVFYLYIQGVLQVENMVSSAYASNGKDLEVYQISSGITYILKNYTGLNDNILRPAEIKPLQ